MKLSFETSISIEYVVIMHKENNGIIYYAVAPGVEFDPMFLESFKRAVEFDEVEMPGPEGDITQAAFKGKFVIIRSCKMVYVILVINRKPDRFTREALHGFGIKFESRWGRELRKLYGELGGDVSIFKQESPRRGSVDDLVEEQFRLTLALPHRLGFPTFQMKGLLRKVWGVAEDLARGKRYLLLGDLLTTARETLRKNVHDISDAIFALVQKKAIVPIPMEELGEYL
ncbi:MAG: hypothetical protein Kow0069_38580 [Promethearchaeota archaeon]